MESRIPLTIGIQNPSSTDKYWNPVPGIQNPQRGVQNPRLSWIPLGCVLTDATTPNIVAPIILGVVRCVLAVVCKRMQQLPTTLGPAVQRGKDTTHKSLYTVRNERAWPQQCWKSCANRSNIIALLFGDHGTKEMLGVVG